MKKKSISLIRICLWLCFLVIEGFITHRFYYPEFKAFIDINQEKGQEEGLDETLLLEEGVSHRPSYFNPNEMLPQSIIDAILLRANKMNHNATSPPIPEAYPDVTERGYPKSTHLVDYATTAEESEVQKHDRLLVQSFVNFHLGSPFLHDSYLKQAYTPTEAQKSNQFICLNIYLCNRRVPYINTMLTSLTSHESTSSRNKFLETMQVRLLNTEKRPERMNFSLARDVYAKLPFVHALHNVTYRDQIYLNQEEMDFREIFISDQLSGLNICIESGLPYCIMVEEDAVVPVDFVQVLLEQVIHPLEMKGVLNRRGGGNVSVISLYSYYNRVFSGNAMLHEPRYSRRKYPKDRSKMNSERKSEGIPPYEANFKVTKENYKYGTVAMLYTRESAQKLVEFMRGVGVNPIHNADEFINAAEYFPSVMGMDRMHVSPSLVNHIGFYSERMADVKIRGMFSQLNTDSRFLFDAGL